MAKSDDIGNSASWKSGKWHRVRLYWNFTLPVDQKYLMIQLDDNYGVYVTNKSAANWSLPSSFSDFGEISNARFFVGSKHDGTWSLNGAIDELKIWDEPILPVTPFPVFDSSSSSNFNPDEPESVATFRELYANDGFCSAIADETYNNQPADCSKLSNSIEPEDSVVFFQKPAFERVYENYVPKESELDTEFSGQGAPGEYETVFFNAYARADLSNVRVTYTDFEGANGTVSKDEADLRVVKNWFQGAALQLPYYTPELMLQNDQVALSAKQLWTGGPYDIPSIPILHHVETKMDQFTSRQFAMTIKVPEETPAGDYVSTISFSADGLGPQTLQMKFEVLPFELQNDGIHSLWYAFPEFVYNDLTEEQRWDITKKNFIDIKNHGFDTVFFYGSITDGFGSNFAKAEKEVSIAKEAGLKRVILYLLPQIVSDYTPYVNMMKSYGFDPWFLGFDEIGETAADYGMVDHINKSILIHQAGGKVVTAGTKKAADRLENPDDPIYTNNFPAGTLEPLDWAIYPMADYKYFVDVMKGQVSKTPNRLESYYWQTYNDDPKVYRYRCGYFQDLTKIDACNPSYYLQRSSKDFYNEFDYFDSGVKWREYMFTGPSWEGPVPTVQWEAAREAVDDSRYLATWRYYKDLVAKTNSDLAEQSEEEIDDVLDHYKDTTDVAYNANYTAEKRNAMAQYEADRKTIIAEIKKLQPYVALYDADINLDSLVNNLDMDILKSDFLKLTANLGNPKSDIDGDGQATVKDVGILMSGWR